MVQRIEENSWQRLDDGCPRLGWLVLFGGALRLAVDGNRVKLSYTGI